MKIKDKELPYNYYNILLADYEYKTILKGKTISVSGYNIEDESIKFSFKIIDSGNALANLEVIESRLKTFLNKLKKKKSINHIINTGLINEVYSNCKNTNTLIDNFNKIKSSNIVIKKRYPTQKCPDNSMNYYYLDNMHLETQKDELLECFNSLTTDKVVNLFAPSNIFITDRYWIVNNDYKNDVNQFKIMKEILEKGENRINELNDFWKDYINKVEKKWILNIWI